MDFAKVTIHIIPPQKSKILLFRLLENGPRDYGRSLIQELEPKALWFPQNVRVSSRLRKRVVCGPGLSTERPTREAAP